MDKCVTKVIKYLGINSPNSIEEIDVEITGLEHAISQANELICRLKQSLALVDLAREEKND
jgi:hypothetical protein